VELSTIAENIAFHQRSGTEMEKITLKYPNLSVSDAYDIQQICIENYYAKSDPMIGWKMGLTSKAKQKSVGVDEAIYGRLTKSMELHEHVLSLENLIHPRIEPEFAFVINKELQGEHITPRDVWMATECVFPAIEVIDSRYKNFSFTLVDVIADNASSSKFLLGNQAFHPYLVSWDQVEVAMYRNGEKVQQGVGAAVLNHPVRSIVELVKMISKKSLSIQPGMIILTGGITEAVEVHEGDTVEADFGQLEKIKIEVRK
jgi:2-oxo-3-hexenedioate decarboxylase